jgi:hypothetical protein
MRLFKTGDIEVAFINNDTIPEETLVKYWNEAKRLYKEDDSRTDIYYKWLYTNKSKVEKLKKISVETIEMITKGDEKKSAYLMENLIKRMFNSYVGVKYSWLDTYFSEVLYSHNIEHTLISGQIISVEDN